MADWTLQEIIWRFDHVVKGVYFDNLPARESEEYRQLVLQTANDRIFRYGIFSATTEWTLEIFDLEKVNQLTCDAQEIARLNEDERIRFSFYMDLKDACLPLFHISKIDWTAWPWLQADGKDTPSDKSFFRLITNEKRPYLGAAILTDLKHRMWPDEDGSYTCVALQDATKQYELFVSRFWKIDATEEDNRMLVMGVWKCATELARIENHLEVGRMLGLDPLSQAIYNSFDTFIDDTFYAKQVICAKELTAWIRENMTIGECRPEPEKTQALRKKMKELMAKYQVVSPDPEFSWNLLTLDILGMGMENR